MSPSQALQKPVLAPPDGVLAGVLCYLLLVLAPIFLKVVGLTRVATWPWWKVTALLWLPWGMLLVLSFLGWLLHLVAFRPGRG